MRQSDMNMDFYQPPLATVGFEFTPVPYTIHVCSFGAKVMIIV